MKTVTAMGNWWFVASSRQRVCSFITSPTEFFVETSNHPGDSAVLQPRSGTLWYLAFPKSKITFQGKRFQTVSEIQKNTMRQLMVIPTKDFAECFEQWKRCWENCVRSQGAYSEGDWDINVLCTMFLVSSSINVSIFHITWLDTFWTHFVYNVLLRFHIRKCLHKH